MMRNVVYAVALMVIGAVGARMAMLSTRDVADTHRVEEWTCGMHPTVVRDGPGACPICGMDLVPRRGNNEPSHHEHQIRIDSSTRQAIGVRTSLVQRGPLVRKVRIVARVVPDERREAIVTSKYSGWVEKIFVNESGQVIRRGQPLLSLYSAEVYAGQEELLLAVRQGNRMLAQSAKERLRSWDVSEGQLKRLVSKGRPERAITRFSPAQGHVLEKHVIDGQYVVAGQPLYRIVNLSRVWVEAEVYEYDVAWLALGQQATLRLAYAPGQLFSGQIGFVYPAVDEASRTVRVRLEFDNPELVMRPGMFGTVELEGKQSDEVVHVADTAVLRSGRRDIVFVAMGEGHYEAREVVLGRAADGGRVEVRSGLQAGERVVTQGQFLLDSESRLQEAIQKMQPPDPNHRQAQSSQPSDPNHRQAQSSQPSDPNHRQAQSSQPSDPNHRQAQSSQPSEAKLRQAASSQPASSQPSDPNHRQAQSSQPSDPNHRQAQSSQPSEAKLRQAASSQPASSQPSEANHRQAPSSQPGDDR